MIAGRVVVLAAGGTGGHLFPAQALAERLAARGWMPVLVTDRRGGVFDVAGGAVATHRIAADSPSRRSLVGKATTAVLLAVGTLQAGRILRRLRPAVVVGFGGYPSIPTMLAASRLGLPTVIHEQNALLGRANRMLAHAATRIATSFPEVGLMRDGDRDRAVRTGNPVRAAIAAVGTAPYPTLTPDGPVALLVTGGSQGATVFADVVPAAVALLPEALRRRLHIAQQCRPEDVERVRAAYAESHVAAECAAFFADMPARLANCHFLVCRAGASTVAEIAAAGRPAVLVPYPFAADDHQRANAQALEAAGAAWTMPQDAFSPKALAQRIECLLAIPDKLAKAAERARAFALPDAAERLADLVAAAAGSNGGHAEPTRRAA